MSTNCSLLSISARRPPKGNRWGSFVASYIVQATAVTALVFYTVTTPTVLPTQVEHVELVAPELDKAPKVAQVKTNSRPSKIAPEHLAKMQPRVAVLKIAAPVLQAQQPQRVRRITDVAEVAQPQLSIAAPKFDSKILNVSPGPKATSRIVATNTFGGSSAAPTVQKPAPSKVQTGGFGDPSVVATNAHGSNRPTIAAAGSFDIPSGVGHGNGSGGSSGARGTVASAGFGNAVAVQGGGGRGGSAGQGRIQSTSFATATAAPDETRRNKAASHQAVSTPVSIQSKPTPVYTSEARQLKVEGEVLLRVVFTADGQIRILNVVRGLGHGLDEAAQHAAQGVRFSPAVRDGHPVDSNATLHIVFQLS